MDITTIDLQTVVMLGLLFGEICGLVLLIILIRR